LMWPYEKKKRRQLQLTDTEALVYPTTNKRAPTPIAWAFLLIVLLS